jgi:UPF0176 protein
MAKKKLYNTIDSRELMKRIDQSDEARITLSFYKYFNIDEPADYRDRLYEVWNEVGVLGRTYIATEGVNAQISIPKDNEQAFADSLTKFGLEGIRLNYAIEDDGKSFYKLVIKVRPKIVADGLDDREINFEKRGTHLNAAEFNELTDKDETIVVDMRNHYESEVGHFEGAILPEVETFRDSLPIVADMLSDRKKNPIVMYCTGGIRCEKASAYMRQQGFENVFQLDGGIIEYRRQVDNQGLDNKFHGKNFVFDERLGERISDEVIARCHQCGEPADTHTNCANDACHLLFIQCEACAEKYHQCCSTKCAEFNQLPDEEQRDLRKTLEFNGTRFSKGRYKAFHRSEQGLELK